MKLWRFEMKKKTMLQEIMNRWEIDYDASYGLTFHPEDDLWYDDGEDVSMPFDEYLETLDAYQVDDLAEMLNGSTFEFGNGYHVKLVLKKKLEKKPAKKRKTGIITRDHLGENRLNYVDLKRKYIELWHEKDRCPTRFVATDSDRRAWAEEDWAYFEKREAAEYGGEPYYG
jgi:hypothetical protein